MIYKYEWNPIATYAPGSIYIILESMIYLNAYNGSSPYTTSEPKYITIWAREYFTTFSIILHQIISANMLVKDKFLNRKSYT